MCVIIIHFLPIINDGGAPRDSLSWYNEAPEGGHLRRSEGLQLSDGRGSVMRLRKLYDQWRQQRYRSSLLVSFHFIYPGSRVVWGCLPRSRIYNTTTRRPMRERERRKKLYIEKGSQESRLLLLTISNPFSFLYGPSYTLYGISSVYPFSPRYVYKVNRMARFSLFKGILTASSSLTRAKSIKMALLYTSSLKPLSANWCRKQQQSYFPSDERNLRKKKKKNLHGDHLSARNMTAQNRPCVKTSRPDGFYYCWCWCNFDSNSSYYCVVV